MRITINTIKEIHANKIAEWKSDPELAKQIMSNFKETSISEAKKWIEFCNSDSDQRLFGIFDTNDTDLKIIGVVRLMYIDWESKNTEFGIYIGDKNYYKKGVGGIVIDQVLEQAFDQIELKKVYLRVSSSNKGAINLYKRKGFKREGVLRDHYLKNDIFEDVYYMSKFK